MTTPAIAQAAAQYLAGCKHVDVRPVRATLGKDVYYGSTYTSVLHYTQSMAAVQDGTKQEGAEYRQRCLYLVGRRPKREAVAYVLAGDEYEWHLSGYYVRTDCPDGDPLWMTPAERADWVSKVHPFGDYFQLSPWDSGGKVDDDSYYRGEKRVWARQPLVLDYLSSTS